jgi:hypothetical protein
MDGITGNGTVLFYIYDNGTVFDNTLMMRSVDAGQNYISYLP